MTNLLLYATTVVIWGSSWLAVQFQLDVLAPAVSVAYRFWLAAAIMIALCLATGRRLWFTRRQHGWLALQGTTLFCVNFWLIYEGSQYLTSGLVAVVFSTIVVMNIVGGAIVFRTPVEGRVAVGAAMGIAGISVVFWPELAAFDLGRDATLGLILALAGTASASVGMLVSARNQKAGLPVVRSNAVCMIYGAVTATVIALVSGAEFALDTRPGYLISLAFLAVFASVIGFWSFLTLLGRIGPARASYATVLFPVVALALSTVFEDFRWTAGAMVGVVLVIAGNAVVLYPRPAAKAERPG